MCNSKLKSLESLDSSDIATLMSKMGFILKYVGLAEYQAKKLVHIEKEAIDAK